MAIGALGQVVISLIKFIEIFNVNVLLFQKSGIKMHGTYSRLKEKCTSNRFV